MSAEFNIGSSLEVSKLPRRGHQARQNAGNHGDGWLCHVLIKWRGKGSSDLTNYSQTEKPGQCQKFKH